MTLARLRQWFTHHVFATLGLALAWLVVLILFLWAIVPSGFTPYSPVEGIAGAQNHVPSIAYPLGTDPLGRDLYTRLVYGAAHSLSGAVIAVGLGIAIGSAFGLLAGTAGRWLDVIIMRLTDILLAVPSLLLSLSIIILLGPGTIHVAIAVGITAIANFTRLVRGEALRIRHSDYVKAAYGSGGNFINVLWRHIAPNTLPTLLAYAIVQLGSAVLAISTLGFLGYGTPPPTPEWGRLIAEGRNYLATAWWLTTFPGIAVVLAVLSTHRISQSFSEAQ